MTTASRAFLRLSYPHPRWAMVRWAPDAALDLDTQGAVAALAELPGVKFHAGPEWTQLDVPRNVWMTDAWALVQNARTFGVNHNAASSGRMSAARAPHLWSPKEPLYAHQVEAARFLVANNGGLCADQMGLGKTRVAIVAAQTLAAQIDSTQARVIIAPGYTRDVWRRELLATGAIKTPEGMAAAYTRDPTYDGFNWHAPWWFIHYDIAHWWQVFMAVRRPSVAILDEVHWIKNGRARRSKAAGTVAGVAPARIALTGTPISNRPVELWWPLTVLDGRGSWGGPGQFRERYCGAVRDEHGLQDTGPTRVPELRERLTTRYIRRTIDDAGVELPPLTRSALRVEFDDASCAKHADVVEALGQERLIEALVRGDGVKDVLAKITKLRKLVSKTKLDATVKLASDMLEQGESVVIFTWQKKTAAKIHDAIDVALEKRDVDPGVLYWLHGGRAQAERDQLVAWFQAKGGLLVATLGALREGVTLTKARHLILHDLDWVPANILQAEARIYRIGQDKPTTVTWVMVDKSIDVLLATCLVAKARVMREVLAIDAAAEAFGELDLATFAGEVSAAAAVRRFLDELEDL